MSRTRLKFMHYTVFFQPQSEGGYTAIVPALPGAISEGDTLKQARENIADAIKAYLESLMKDGEPVPKDLDVQPVKKRVRVPLVIRSNARIASR